MFEDISVLRDLAQLPASPFHEERVARYILARARGMGLETQQDTYGNIFVRYRNRHDGADVQPLALVAHMDHPGLEIVAVEGQRSQGRLMGGVQRAYFEHEVHVQVHTPAGVVRGRSTGYRVEGEPPALTVDLEVDGAVDVGDFCVWDMIDFEEDGDFLRMRAADDLAGCAATLYALQEAAARGLPGDVCGVFTRAEEVGLVGASLVAQEGTLSLNTVVVSLESSRTLPGAEVGEGPVIRVGDAQTTFHPEGEALFHEARRRLLQADPSLKVQRQLMSGGTCEATMFGLMGYRTTGLAFPLENYHNMGPDNRILPEAIHRRDFGTAIELLILLIEAAGGPFTNPLRDRYLQLGKGFRDRLTQTFRNWKA